ncbi:MAG: glycosyltransferase family 39 protein [Bacteroidia bacterium]|nr:glycosyltransferase family 39 protein [Bacteroidia bacterium]
MKSLIDFSSKKAIFYSVLILLLVRIASLLAMGIMPQDAYYAFYGENLALSYFDHPPLIGWILRLFMTIFGKNIYAVHLADFTVTLGSVFVFYQLAKRILSLQKATTAVLFFFSTIMVSILSIISTPDVPLMFFWPISLLFAHKAIKENYYLDWILTGIFMGCAFLSKYTALFLPAGLFLFLLITNWKKIASLRFFSTIFFFVLVSSPVIVWNIQHDFISFKFQSGSRFRNLSWSNISAVNFLGTLGHQLFILIPVLLGAILFFLRKYVTRGFKKLSKLSIDNIFLLSFFLPLFFFFFCISILYWVKVNWMMPAYITGIIWVSQYCKQRLLKSQLIISVVVHVLMFLFIVFYPIPVKSDDTWWGWNKLNTEVEQRMHNHPGYFLFAFDDYKTSAVLHFISGRKVYSGNLLGEPALQYSIVDKNAPQKLTGQNALFLDSKPRFDNEGMENNIPLELKQHFDSVIELKPILIRNNNRKAFRKFLVYECKSYKP